MVAAVAVEPVKATPASAGCVRATSPKGGPSAGVSCSTAAGTPASCSSRVMACAMSGVAGAGFATTALPATSAAVICPVKIASGKFHGLMQTNTPRPWSESVLRSPVGPGKLQRRAEGLAAARGVVAAEIHRFAQLRHGIRQRLAGLAHQQAQELAAPLLQQLRGLLQARRAHRRRGRIPVGLRRRRRFHAEADLRCGCIAGAADDLARVSGRGDRHADIVRHAAAEYRAAGMALARMGAHFGGERRERGRIAEVLALGIGALGAKQRVRLAHPRRLG